MATPPPIIIPAELDEAKLSFAAFRVLGHLSRRGAGQNGAWGSIKGMADMIGCDNKTVVTAIGELLETGWITRTSRPGITSLYQIGTEPKKRVNPKNGLTQKTGQGLTQKTGQGLTQKTGYEGVKGRSQDKESQETTTETGSSSPETPPDTDTATSSKPASPPKKEKGRRLKAPEYPDDLPDDYRLALDTWFTYKREARSHYTAQGWATLVKQQRRHPATIVADSVENSIANNYAGLFTDRLATQRANPTRLPPQAWTQRGIIPPEKASVSQGIQEPDWDWRPLAQDLGLHHINAASHWTIDLDRSQQVRLLREKKKSAAPVAA
jgi:hypothetical protein